jgi:hypothetical protein
MCPKWSGDFDVSLLLKTIERSKQKDEATGKVSFRHNDGTLDDALAVSDASVVFDETIPESLYRGLILRSLFSVAESRDLTTEALLAESSRREQAYKETPPKRYVLTTSLSARATRSPAP